MKKKEEKKKEDNICLQFIESIEKELLTCDAEKYICISNFTSIIIDGIEIDIHIRKYNNTYEYRMQTFKIEFTRNERDFYLTFLDKENFKTLLDLLIDIKVVMKSFHFLDHRLLSPDSLNFAKLQRSFFTLSKDNECSICYECTNEYTMCRHPICFQCRFSCIKQNNSLCPICREDNLKTFPEELTFE